MKERQRPQEVSNEILLCRSRKLLSTRVRILTLMVALCMVSLKSTASAQTCMHQCQQNLTQCMQTAGGDPIQEISCQNEYDKCGQDCM